ncbi:phosphoribosylglycinamide formyltransferase [Thermodesulfitimonas autotrophica]|uniref:phosphoribosylglycinamide formyltransferase n=1 Tax=Thermodesulfitimonas autotrophica TaxID=1894989 RepID=UPI002FE3DFD8
MVGLRIGWFSTGRDAAARELLQMAVAGIASGELPLAIAFVFCNREEGEDPESDAFIKQVRGYGLPLITFSAARFKPDLRRRMASGDEAARLRWREDYHLKVLELIAPFEVAFSFLAGYMLIVGAAMCRRHMMLNLHPALPGGPKGTWQEVIWQLIAQRAQEAGAMIHLVTPELDAGPPVSYCRFSLATPLFAPLWAEMEEKLRAASLEAVQAAEGERNALFQAIRREEFARELPLIWLTLQKLAAGVVRVADGRVFVGGAPSNGIDLSAEVDRLLPFSPAEVRGRGNAD